MSDQTLKNQLIQFTNTESLKSRDILFSTAKVGKKAFNSNVMTSSDDFMSNRESLTTDEMFPRNLRPIVIKLVEFLEEYYNAENQDDILGFSNIINSLYEARDIDLVNTSDESLYKWFYEFANSFAPETEMQIDKRTFLKYVKSILNEKGSENSIKMFFRLFFGSDASVYYPWEDVLIASDGNWNDEERTRVALDETESELKGFTISKGHFENSDNFLDDYTYLQDSFYYQRFSYDVRSDVPNEKWAKVFKDLIHPSGFIGFSTFMATLFANQKWALGKMPREQMGIFFGVSIRVLLSVAKKIREKPFILSSRDYFYSHDDFFADNTFTRFTFMNGEPISNFDDLTIGELSTNARNLAVSSRIVIEPI